mmetsp:Transcript_9481/g.11015  ORF Transcript_9481/g.11015 Transcript_9481/m.11015 type:complete len:113 (-) Transcript_9481:294-632(-)
MGRSILDECLSDIDIVACLCSQSGDMILTETSSSNRGHKPGTFLTVVKGIHSSTDGDSNTVVTGMVVFPNLSWNKSKNCSCRYEYYTSQLVVSDFVKQLRLQYPPQDHSKLK